MKIRSDFVTNSSSSSFIIGKKDDTSATIESVFQTIKKFYEELLDVRDNAINYILTHPKMKMKYINDHFECKEKDHKKKWSLEDKFEKQFGFSTWAYFDEEYDWLKCATYAEYESYWLEKMKDTSNWRVHAPFTIADFMEEKEIQWLHFHFDPEYDSKTHKVNSKSDVLNWYFPYIEESFKYNGNCDECDYAEYCHEESRDKCEKNRRLDVPEDKACLYLLGRVCIHSENGYIHEYVVNKLSDISEYSCNHMG